MGPLLTLEGSNGKKRAQKLFFLKKPVNAIVDVLINVLETFRYKIQLRTEYCLFKEGVPGIGK